MFPTKKNTKVYEIFTVYKTLCSRCQIDGENFVNFCGFIRKHELYLNRSCVQDKGQEPGCVKGNWNIPILVKHVSNQTEWTILIFSYLWTAKFRCFNVSFQEICYCKVDGCNESKSNMKTDSTILYLMSTITFLTISDLQFGR